MYNIKVIAQGASLESGGCSINVPSCNSDTSNEDNNTSNNNTSSSNDLVWEIPLECRDENQVQEDYWAKYHIYFYL